MPRFEHGDVPLDGAELSKGLPRRDDELGTGAVTRGRGTREDNGHDGEQNPEIPHRRVGIRPQFPPGANRHARADRPSKGGVPYRVNVRHCVSDVRDESFGSPTTRTQSAAEAFFSSGPPGVFGAISVFTRPERAVRSSTSRRFYRLRAERGDLPLERLDPHLVLQVHAEVRLRGRAVFHRLAVLAHDDERALERDEDGEREVVELVRVLVERRQERVAERPGDA